MTDSIQSCTRHHADQRDQRHRIARHRSDGHAEQVADAVDVLVDLRGQVGRPVIGEEADAELHQMVEQPLLVAGDQIVADLGKHHRLAVGGDAADHESRR